MTLIAGMSYQVLRKLAVSIYILSNTQQSMSYEICGRRIVCVYETEQIHLNYGILLNISAIMKYLKISLKELKISYKLKEKRKRSDSVLWQRPTANSKKQSDNKITLLKTSIEQRLLTYLGRSVGVTTVTKLVWLNQFTGSQPSH